MRYIGSGAFANGGGGAPGSDPYFSSVVLLLPFDEGDESATTTDYSQYAHTIGLNGVSSPCRVDTAQFKYGTASCRVNGTADADVAFLSVADHAAFNLGTSDFTIEFHFRSSVAPITTARYFGAHATTAGTNITTAWAMSYNTSGQLVCTAYSDVDAIGSVTSVGSLSQDTWHHISYNRSGNAFYNSLDGTVAQAAVGSSGTINNSTGNLCFAKVGDFVAADGVVGWFDNIRITVGQCRYTANFTPPTAAFPTY